jgi:hypothetical protein
MYEIMLVPTMSGDRAVQKTYLQNMALANGVYLSKIPFANGAYLGKISFANLLFVGFRIRIFIILI